MCSSQRPARVTPAYALSGNGRCSSRCPASGQLEEVMWAAEACEGCVTITLFTYQATPCRCSLLAASDHLSRSLTSSVVLAASLNRRLPGATNPMCCVVRGSAETLKKCSPSGDSPGTATDSKPAHRLFLSTDSLQDQLVNSAHSLTQLLTTRRVFIPYR